SCGGSLLPARPVKLPAQGSRCSLTEVPRLSAGARPAAPDGPVRIPTVVAGAHVFRDFVRHRRKRLHWGGRTRRGEGPYRRGRFTSNPLLDKYFRRFLRPPLNSPPSRLLDPRVRATKRSPPADARRRAAPRRGGPSCPSAHAAVRASASRIRCSPVCLRWP